MEEGGGEGDVSSSNEMPQLEMKRTGEGDGEEGIVDNSLRADEEKGEKKKKAVVWDAMAKGPLIV